jgi:protein arginine kinase
MQITDTTGELEEAWNRLLKIEMEISNDVTFSYHEKFGFLTADPTTCGTGLLITAFLQLTALKHTGELKKALTKHQVEGIEATGLQGDPNNLIGDVVVLYNNYKLGLTEESIVTSIRSALTRLYVEEKSVRVRIRDSGDEHIKDAVSRAYGLLMHSYQVETVEALEAISLLKLGLEFEWLKGPSIKELNTLFFQCRRGHLLIDKEIDHDPEIVLHARAELIHSTLNKAKLTI